MHPKPDVEAVGLALMVMMSHWMMHQQAKVAIVEQTLAEPWIYGKGHCQHHLALHGVKQPAAVYSTCMRFFSLKTLPKLCNACCLIAQVVPLVFSISRKCRGYGVAFMSSAKELERALGLSEYPDSNPCRRSCRSYGFDVCSPAFLR